MAFDSLEAAGTIAGRRCQLTLTQHVCWRTAYQGCALLLVSLLRGQSLVAFTQAAMDNSPAQTSYTPGQSVATTDQPPTCMTNYELLSTNGSCPTSFELTNRSTNCCVRPAQGKAANVSCCEGECAEAAGVQVHRRIFSCPSRIMSDSSPSTIQSLCCLTLCCARSTTTANQNQSTDAGQLDMGKLRLSVYALAGAFVLAVVAFYGACHVCTTQKNCCQNVSMRASRGASPHMYRKVSSRKQKPKSITMDPPPLQIAPMPGIASESHRQIAYTVKQQLRGPSHSTDKRDRLSHASGQKTLKEEGAQRSQQYPQPALQQAEHYPQTELLPAPLQTQLSPGEYDRLLQIQTQRQGSFPHHPTEHQRQDQASTSPPSQWKEQSTDKQPTLASASGQSGTKKHSHGESLQQAPDSKARARQAIPRVRRSQPQMDWITGLQTRERPPSARKPSLPSELDSIAELT